MSTCKETWIEVQGGPCIHGYTFRCSEGVKKEVPVVQDMQHPFPEGSKRAHDVEEFQEDLRHGEK